MTSVHEADRGLTAVARVRGVREQDSRLGLQQALAEQAGRVREVERLERGLAEHASFRGGSVQEFVALRAGLAVLGEDIARARRDLEVAATVADEARGRWTRDKSRLSAVETLLERRRTERAAERARAEARELDDIGVQLWQRRAGGDR